MPGTCKGATLGIPLTSKSRRALGEGTALWHQEVQKLTDEQKSNRKVVLMAVSQAGGPSCPQIRDSRDWTACYTPTTPLHVLCIASEVSDSETPWTIACQVPLSMGFSQQEYWSGLPFPPSGDLPDPGIGMPPTVILIQSFKGILGRRMLFIRIFFYICLLHLCSAR